MQRFIPRKQLRLKHYDYSSAGIYFVTICVNYRQCLFGEIVNQQMILSDAGMMVESYYHDLEYKFNNIICGEYVVMPNHFHCLIHIQNNIGSAQSMTLLHDRADIESAPTITDGFNVGGESISPRVSLPQIIQTFKRQTTIEYIKGVKTKKWQSFNKRLWQRNYYEHIIRNEKSYNEICKYIQQNPVKWELDNLNPKNIK